MKVTAAVLPPRQRLEDVCSPRCRDLISEHFQALFNDQGRDCTGAELEALVGDAQVVLTSWGSPPIDERVLAKATRLRVVGHAAGSVKRLVTPSVFDQGVQVFSAAPRIAESVGEYCLAAILTLLRRLRPFDATVRGGGWKTAGLRGHELRGKQVGIVAASATARALLGLLAPFQVDVAIYDPYLSDEQAAALGARKATLDSVMRCEVVSIHAPATPETAGLVTRELIRGLPDGAVLVNSARAATLDQQALTEELVSGRVLAALDVFAQEPPALDDRLRTLDNVLLTPHIAGDTREGHLALMEEVVEDILRFLAGEPPGRTAVDPSHWDVMA